MRSEAHRHNRALVTTPDGGHLGEWLALVGLPIGTVFGTWQLLRAYNVPRDEGYGVDLEFGRGDARLKALLQPGDKERRVFERSKSLDLSYPSVPDHLKDDAIDLMRRVITRVKSVDQGDIPLPPQDNPSLRVVEEAPLFDFAFTDLETLDQYPDALDQMYRGNFGGLIVRNVYDPEDMARVVARLEGDDSAYPRAYFPETFRSWMLGNPLDGAEENLRGYLDAADNFREHTAALFEGMPDFETRIQGIFERLAGGRPVSVPTYQGRAYTPATIRVLPVGGQIGPHCGNECSTREGYTQLNPMIDRSDQISFFLTLRPAAEGGELIVYDLKFDDITEEDFIDGHSDVDRLLDESRWAVYRPEAGDLIAFDGGRHFHRVSVVRGEQTRWTIGGFLMFSTDASEIYYWS